MGLIRKIFGKDDAGSSGSSQFAESQSRTSLEETKSRNAPRRDLVRVVLRETMRRQDDNEFDFRVERSGDEAKMTINAVRKDGQFRNKLDSLIRVVGPDQVVAA